jgi:hypothetical protein
MVVVLAACGSKDSETAAGESSFAVRKASIDAYMKAVESAGGYDAALAAGQAWVDANLAAYKTNCAQLVKDRQDLKKSKQAAAHRTDLKAYTARLHAVAGHDPKKMDMKALKRSAALQKQLNGFFNCDNALK